MLHELMEAGMQRKKHEQEWKMVLGTPSNGSPPDVSWLDIKSYMLPGEVPISTRTAADTGSEGDHRRQLIFGSWEEEHICLFPDPF